ncbi:hypothetical protein [Cryobacterium melibiosiphilum]|uniref:hypothetical protein n=1 Tax=Cryobacterium melibiosiphilum TaxID=995039 RepID=UPI0011C20F1D|nr:hypothetical protein [Cryobacterium melibiosiphilum]
MSDANVKPEDAATRARAIIEANVDARVEAVRVLADAGNEYGAADQQLKLATLAHEHAWTAALASGWSEKDLRATGVKAPGQSAPKARKRRTTVPPKTTTTEA